MRKHFLFTSEAVSAGHPDKVADQISDAVLDAFLAKDPTARVAVETLVTTNHVTLAGEVRSQYNPHYEEVVRQTIDEIGYTPDMQADFNSADVKITNLLHEQAAEIAQGVDAGDRESEGAGDQGIMFGFAIRETDPQLMPAPLYYAHEILRKLGQYRQQDPRLRPDAKSQLTFEYENGIPKRLDTLLVSHQHAAELDVRELQEIVLYVARPLLGDMLDKNTRILVNPTGSFVQGGPAQDTGLTGRKIIVDTYGGMAHHGGGAFSGKDPTKVDRSAAYAARYLAKNVVAAGLAYVCEIQLCYAIGVPEPLALYVNTFGTGEAGIDRKLSQILPKVMDLTPRGIRTKLGLNKPIYRVTAAGCHFGRAPGHDGPGTYGWEEVDLVQAIQQAL